MNYTPENMYQTYNDSSMVAYEMLNEFQELEPIYHDEDILSKLDQDREMNLQVSNMVSKMQILP